MKTLFRGSDKGSALPIVLLLLFAITLIFFSVSTYVHSSVSLAKKEKQQSLMQLAEHNIQTGQVYDAY